MKTKIISLGLILLLSGCNLYKMGLRIETSRREGYINAHPNLESSVKRAILAGEVFIGMTQEQVVASRGRPYDINRTTGSWGVHEQWVMHSHRLGGPSLFAGKKEYGYGYIYFENGRVVSWQSW